MSFSLKEQKSCLFQTGQDFLAHKTFGQHMYGGPLKLNFFFKKRVKYCSGHPIMWRDRLIVEFTSRYRPITH